MCSQSGHQRTEYFTKALPIQAAEASKLLRDSVGDISDDIVIQGSRASGTAKPTFDNPPFIPFK